MAGRTRPLPPQGRKEIPDQAPRRTTQGCHPQHQYAILQAWWKILINKSNLISETPAHWVSLISFDSICTSSQGTRLLFSSFLLHLLSFPATRRKTFMLPAVIITGE